MDPGFPSDLQGRITSSPSCQGRKSLGPRSVQRTPLCFFRNTCHELLSISLLVSLFYVVRRFRLFLLNNFYYDILNIVIPIINSVTSGKLKKAGTWNGQPKYWFKKAVHVVTSAFQQSLDFSFFASRGILQTDSQTSEVVRGPFEGERSEGAASDPGRLRIRLGIFNHYPVFVVNFLPLNITAFQANKYAFSIESLGMRRYNTDIDCFRFGRSPSKQKQ